MRKHLTLLCGYLLVACADEAPESNGSSVGGAGGETSPIDTSLQGLENDIPSGEAPVLYPSFDYSPQACADNSVLLVGRVVDANLDLVDGAICRYAFSDGTTADGCTVIHSVPTPGNVVLTAYDPITGATGRFEQLVSGPLSFTATLDVTTTGLSISWHAATLYGPTPNVGSVQIAIQPAEKVVAPDPSVFSRYDGTVTVTEAGTYTVTFDSTISFGESGFCSEHVERSTSVTCDVTQVPL